MYMPEKNYEWMNEGFGMVHTWVAFWNVTSSEEQLRLVRSELNGLQRRGTDWFAFVKLEMTLSNSSMILYVTILLFKYVSITAFSSTHGKMSSSAVWAVGFTTHSSIATHVSPAILLKKTYMHSCLFVYSHI